jgi:hypothetical protein
MEDMSNEDVIQSLKDCIPNLLLALHDIASKKRRQAKLTLRALCERVNADYSLQEALVSITVACLAGQSETIRAGVVEALGLYAYALEDCEGLKQRFIKIVLLLDKHSPQMARSVVKFLRLTIQGVKDPDTLQSCFDYFLKSIMSSEVARSACRVRIRTFIEKLGKRFGWVALEKMMPEAHMQLFRYTRRMYNRRVRKCQAKGLRKEEAADLSSSDSEDGEDGEVCILEDGEKPVDLQSDKLPLILSSRISKEAKQGEKLKLSSDGRLVVEDEDMVQKELPQVSPPRRVSLSDLAELRSKHDALRKARMVERTEGGGGRSLKSLKKASSKEMKNRRRHELSGLSQFAPVKKNAFGDTKRSENGTDPFAYVRLNPSLVREKYKSNAIASISKVIRKTGEKAGRKMNKRGRSGVDGGLFAEKPEKRNSCLVVKKNQQGKPVFLSGKRKGRQ